MAQGPKQQSEGAKALPFQCGQLFIWKFLLLCGHPPSHPYKHVEFQGSGSFLSTRAVFMMYLSWGTRLWGNEPWRIMYI